MPRIGTGHRASTKFRSACCTRPRTGGVAGGLVRLIFAIIVAIAALFGYVWNTSENEATGEKQRVALSAEEEIALGLESRSEMAAEFGGLLPDENAQERVDAVGARLLDGLERTLADAGRRNPYPFEFHLLTDPRTVNAFALPGGQIFITTGLYSQLETEGQLAVVLAHEMGHVLARHGAEQLAKAQLTEGLAGAAGVATGDPDAAQIAAVVGTVVNMRHGRNAEYEADRWGVRLAYAAGYDPRAIFGVMKILDAASRFGPPEFLSTHPKPGNRIAYAEKVLKEEFPRGVPKGLEP